MNQPYYPPGTVEGPMPLDESKQRGYYLFWWGDDEWPKVGTLAPPIGKTFAETDPECHLIMPAFFGGPLYHVSGVVAHLPLFREGEQPTPESEFDRAMPGPPPCDSTIDVNGRQWKKYLCWRPWHEEKSTPMVGYISRLGDRQGQENEFWLHSDRNIHAHIGTYITEVTQHYPLFEAA